MPLSAAKCHWLQVHYGRNPAVHATTDDDSSSSSSAEAPGRRARLRSSWREVRRQVPELPLLERYAALLQTPPTTEPTLLNDAETPWWGGGEATGGEATGGEATGGEAMGGERARTRAIRGQHSHAESRTRAIPTPSEAAAARAAIEDVRRGNAPVPKPTVPTTAPMPSTARMPTSDDDDACEPTWEDGKSHVDEIEYPLPGSEALCDACEQVRPSPCPL